MASLFLFIVVDGNEESDVPAVSGTMCTGASRATSSVMLCHRRVRLDKDKAYCFDPLKREDAKSASRHCGKRKPVQ